MKILAVDDEPNVLALFGRVFLQPAYTLVSTGDSSQAMALALHEMPDVILLDLRMPQLAGQDVLNSLRKNFMTQRIPIVIVSANDDMAQKVSGFALGADDYITKPFEIEEILARVKAILNRNSAHMSANPLTNLPGGPAIEKMVSQRIEAGVPCAFIYLDIDNFKAVNDAYGYLKGDEMIKALGAILIALISASLASTDFVGHIGGDDFVYVCDATVAESVAQQIAYEFDATVPRFYSGADREKGVVESYNRKGERQQFPLATLSIAIVIPSRLASPHYADVVKRANEIKRFLKTSVGRRGSIYLTDRRVGARWVPSDKPVGS